MGYVRQTTEIECPGYGKDVTVKPKEERKKNIEPRNKDIIKKRGRYIFPPKQKF